MDGASGSLAESVSEWAPPPQDDPSFGQSRAATSSTDGLIFQYRCLKILAGLTLHTMSQDFAEQFVTKPLEEWARLLWAVTTPPVRELLDRFHPPSIADVLFISEQWVDTGDWGTYACLLVPEDPEEQCHMYAGSATGEGGIKARKGLRDDPKVLKRQGGYFHRLLFDEQVPRAGHWLVLSRIGDPDKDPSMDPDDRFERTFRRVISRLAEGVYSIWLGAFQIGQGHPELFTLSPFNMKDLPWAGACSHSPLAEPLQIYLDANALEKAQYLYTDNFELIQSSRERLGLPRQMPQLEQPQVERKTRAQRRYDKVQYQREYDRKKREAAKKNPQAEEELKEKNRAKTARYRLRKAGVDVPFLQRGAPAHNKNRRTP